MPEERLGRHAEVGRANNVLTKCAISPSRVRHHHGTHLRKTISLDDELHHCGWKEGQFNYSEGNGIRSTLSLHLLKAI